ncbi:MAG: delta(24(24(1)))-sterol reductase, partial [Bdellovibrionota bacterium]
MSKKDDFSKFRHYEFGGPIGAVFIMLFSHFLVYYLWVTVSFHGASAYFPNFFSDIFEHVRNDAAPTTETALFYVGFILLQALFAYTLPGVRSKGLPIPSLGGKALDYLCNGAAAWYVTLLLAAGLHISGIFRLTFLVDHLGPLLTVSVIFGDLVALYVYLEAKLRKIEHRASGNALYDFFMGINLNPRIGILDIKMFFEIRISWILLFLVTLSAALKQVEILGTLTASSAFMVVAHFLYTNACQKGEECIPPTWDFFYENFGWYLAFWNCSGVAFTYSFQSLYLLKNGPIVHSTPYMVLIFSMLFFAYYIWDTSQSQKNRFRMKLQGTYVKRHTFPQLPWGTLENPKYLKTKSGSTLLIDG